MSKKGYIAAPGSSPKGSSPRSAEPAVLGKGLRVRGHVRGEGDLWIEADIEGDVVVSGAIELKEGGRIEGGVEASSILVAGALNGDMKASGPVTLAASARVHGDVSAAELSIAEGAVFVGRVEADFELPDDIA